MNKLTPSTIKNKKQYDKFINLTSGIVSCLKYCQSKVFYEQLNLIIMKLSRLLTDEDESIRIYSRDILVDILKFIDN
jgi:hypothetical protein